MDETFSGNGLSMWVLGDHQHSTRATYSVDPAFGLLNRKEYDSFGRVIDEMDEQPIVDTIFGYTGREFDDETGLHYNRARYYDPDTGRFLSQDPSGIELSGDYNLYRYAGNNPLNATDPTGLATSYLGQAASAVGAGLGSALGVYSNLSAGLSNAAASGIASGLGALSQPPVVRAYNYVGGYYQWHDLANEQVYYSNPLSRPVPTINSPPSAPSAQSQYASLAGFAFGGLATGLKAVVNQGAKTIASTATLGFYEAGNVWTVNQWDQSVANYDQSAFAARIGTEALQTALTAGLAQADHTPSTAA